MKKSDFQSADFLGQSRNVSVFDDKIGGFLWNA